MPNLEPVKLEFKVKSDHEKATKATIGAIDKVAAHANLKKAEIAGAVRSAAKGVAAMGAVAAGVLVVSAKAAIDFESSFAGVRKTVDLTEEGFKQLSDAFREMAKQKPINVNELNRIAEMAGQLGVSGVKNLTKFTGVMADMANTTNLTSEGAATQFAKIANVMQLPLDQVDKMGSVVVALGNNFATTERDIVNFSQRIASAGSIAGLSTGEVMGISAAMSSVGITAEAGGTAVSKALFKINDAVSSGGEELELFAAVSGMTTEEFQKGWKEDASGAFATFVNGLGEAGGDASKILEELELSDMRVKNAFLSLAGAGDVLNTALDTQSVAWEENKAMTEEAKKRYETTESQMLLVKNQIADMAITLGEVLLPKISELIDTLTPVIDKISVWIEKNPELTKNILLVFAAVGLLAGSLLVLAPIVKTGIILFKAFKGIAVLLNLKKLAFIETLGGLAKTLFTKVIPSLWATLAPFLPIILAVAAAIAIVALLAVAWKKNMFNIRGITEKIINFVIGKFNSLIDKINALIELINLIPGIEIGTIGKIGAVSFDKTVGGGEPSGGFSPAFSYALTDPNYTPYTPTAPMSIPNQSTVQNFNVSNNIYGDIDTEAMIRDLAYQVNTE